MRKKMINNKGYSLSELLMVVLILSLLVVIIGSGMGVVRNTYERITLQAESQTLLSTTIARVRDELRFAKDIKADQPVEGTNTATTFVSGNRGMKAYFSNDEARGVILVDAVDKSSMAMVSDKTMTNGLTTEIKYNYNTVEKIINVTINVIYKGGDYATQAFKVKPLNT